MRKWQCVVCGFVYDEAAGLPEEGIEPGTPWEDIPADWVCPDCGVGKIDFDYEEIADALGWSDFGNDDFEEIMSTHYGRMVVLDDRVLLFANPEDAAEYIDFDLQVVE